MNKVTLYGRLGKDPEVRYTQSGKAVANFTLATREYNDGVEWHRVVAWEKTAETVGEYLKKGSEAIVEGRLQTRKWEDKDGNARYTTEVVAFSVTFVGGKADADQRPTPPQNDDIPF